MLESENEYQQIIKTMKSESPRSPQASTKKTQPAVSREELFSLGFVSRHMNKITKRSWLALGLFAMIGMPNSQALVVPFLEDFESGNANWLNGASASSTWLSTGGVDDGGFISASTTVVNTGFGAISFRGNALADASGDAFVGDWLAGGVTLFTTYVRHNAPTNLNFFARLDAGSGRAGSSVNFSVAPNTWTQLSVPILDSPSSFQSYGAGTFSTVFNNIQNVQIVLSSVQDSGMFGQTYAIDADRISVVPEPGPIGLAAGAGLLLMGLKVLRKRKAQV
jgi:hypothetical protein